MDAMRDIFGHDRILNISTYGTEGTKSALLTSARGLGIDIDEAQYLTSMIPEERGFDWPLKDVVEGNNMLERKPIATFIKEIGRHPGWLDTAMAFEGLVTNRGSHAAGVYFFNDNYNVSNAMMKSTSGVKVTQWSMLESDQLGGVKFDFLSTDAMDKMRVCIDLMIEDKLIERKETLRETYDAYLEPNEVIDYRAELWEPAWRGEVLSLFQFQTPVGGVAIQKGKPVNVRETAALNSLMRLTPFPDGETPVDKYARMSANISEWYAELKKYRLSTEEVQTLEPHYLPSKGVPNTQEELMLLLMDEKVCGFTESEANVARKIIGKKLMHLIPDLKEKIYQSRKCSKEMIDYIWDTAVQVQLGYSFSILHSIAYSIIGLQELNLYGNYPSIYWNTSCLIVDSKGDKGSADFKKIAQALGRIRALNINVDLLDVNESLMDFKPSLGRNSIVYGMNAVVGLNSEIAHRILSLRPFVTVDEFFERVQPTKSVAVTLVKSGGLDNLYAGKSRRFIMADVMLRFSEPRKQLTMASLPLLVSLSLVPEELMYVYRIYEFNRYLRSEKKDEIESTGYFRIGLREEGFFNEVLSEYDSQTEQNGEGEQILSYKRWEKIYAKEVAPMQQFIKDNLNDLLNSVEIGELSQEYEEKFSGTISRWEMDSVCFYHSEHELAGIDSDRYGVRKYSELPYDADIVGYWGKFPKFALSTIVGTVIAKDSRKGSISILTPEGDVVLVKLGNSRFSWYDRQISEIGFDGKKKVLEKGWFGRGSLLMITGFRRENQFVPKTYADTGKKALYKIDSYFEDGSLHLLDDRVGS